MMDSRQYQVKLTGITPLLMHQDNFVGMEGIKKWQTDPANRKMSTAGDDRTPAWLWMVYLYSGSGKVCIPSDNLMTMLREGGARCPTGKKGGTFKRQTQSGIVVDHPQWSLSGLKGEIDITKIDALVGNNNFEEHEKIAVSLGFSLFVKRAKIGQAKHIRVRPRFDTWSCGGTVTVFDETITEDVLRTIISHAGNYAGIGDWRPSSPSKPGSWGKFICEVKAL